MNPGHCGFLPKVVDVPMQLFLPFQMPGYAGIEVVHGRANISVPAFLKIKISEFAHTDFQSSWKVEQQYVNAFVHEKRFDLYTTPRSAR
jgi:hypothetical protein